MNKTLIATLMLAAFVAGCASHHHHNHPTGAKIGNHPQKITPFLWFDGKAEEAAKFYISVFKNSKIVTSNPMSATFELDGVEFIALNAGPQFKFTPAISFFVKCDTQAEIDYYWEKLCAGGEPGQCGWLKDQFGVSWQVVPPVLGQMLSDKDPLKAKRVADAMMQMKKLDIQKLQQAYEWK